MERDHLIRFMQGGEILESSNLDDSRRMETRITILG